MVKQVVAEPTMEQSEAYSNFRYYGLRSMSQNLLPNQRAMLQSIGILPDQYRTLNGHEYPIFESEVDYTRWLRHGMTFDEQMQHDIDVWYETIDTSRPVKAHIMAKIFTVLRWNEFRWKKGNSEGFADPEDHGKLYEWNLASALSHGSRICFVIPKATHKGFRDWLTCSLMGRSYIGNVIEHRWVGKSSHDASPVMTTSGRVDVNEVKIGGIGHVTGGFHGYGMDLAMGELNGPSPIDGRRIEDNGLNGHMFFFESNVHTVWSGWSPSRWKIMMVGIEASGPVSGGDLYGSSHGSGGEQNGTGVSVYWHKNEKAGNFVGMDNLPNSYQGYDDVPAKYGGMVVYLTQSMHQMQQQYLTAVQSMSNIKEMLEYVPAIGGPQQPQMIPSDGGRETWHVSNDAPDFADSDWD